MEAASLVIDQPEIFGRIISYLIYKPSYAINFALASRKLHQNLYSTISWNSAGFNFLLSSNGRIDKNALDLALQKIDNERLIAKNIKIQQKITAYTRMRENRGRKPTLMGPGSVVTEEATKFQQLRDALNVAHGIDKTLPVDFYEQILVNQILSESVIKSIANTIDDRFKLVSEIFRAFNFVLSTPRADLELEAKKNENVFVKEYREISSWGRTQPALRGLYIELDEGATDPNQLMNADTFIVCSGEDHDYDAEWDERVIFTYSCFFKYICDNKKAVIFVTQYSDDNTKLAVYWKVDLVTKAVEAAGSLHDLARKQQARAGSNKFSRLTRALLELFEIDITNEVLQKSRGSEWLYECSAKAFVVQSLADAKL